MLYKDDRLVLRNGRFCFLDKRNKEQQLSNGPRAWQSPGMIFNQHLAHWLSDQLSQFLQCRIEVTIKSDDSYEWEFRSDPDPKLSTSPMEPLEFTLENTSEPALPNRDPIAQKEFQRNRSNGYKGIAWVLQALFNKPFEIQEFSGRVRFSPPPPDPSGSRRSR